MGFLKRNYEKILLGAVLLGLAAAVALLPIKISREKAAVRALSETLLHPNPKPLPDLDLSQFSSAFDRLQKPAALNYSKPHNLFNPVPWQKKPDGTLIPVRNGNEIGPDALVVVKLNPLFTTVSFESVGASGSNYLVSVTRDAEISSIKRRKKSFYLEPGVKGDFLTLLEVKGTPEKPQLSVLINDSGEKVSISAEHSYQRVDGYSADLRYDPEKHTWLGRRINDRLTFAGDVFNVATINHSEVVVSANSTGKKTTRAYSPDAQP